MFRVTFSPEARADLRELHHYIALRSSRKTATGYLLRLRNFCQGLAVAPRRGEARVHRPGLRTIGFERRISVVFAVFEEEQTVEIIGFDYAGRQYR